MPPTYPRSRTHSNGQCKMCRLHPGDMVAKAILTIPSWQGRSARLLQWTCVLCGYTELYDLSVQESVPIDGGDEVPDISASS